MNIPIPVNPDFLLPAHAHDGVTEKLVDHWANEYNVLATW